MNDSTSSLHFHSACNFDPRGSSEDPAACQSLVSSLTITDGFNLWGSARGCSSNDATEHRPPPGPAARAAHPASHKSAWRLQAQVGTTAASDNEAIDVTWHRPPPPPPAAPQEGDAAGLPRRAIANADERSCLTTATATASANEVLLENAEASPAPLPRRRTVRTTLLSASNKKQRQ